MLKPLALRPESIPLIGSVLACIFWVLDSAVDTYIFKLQHLYLENLLGPTSVELWTRCLIIIILMVFSLIVMTMMRSHQQLSERLDKHKRELDRIARKRLDNLSQKNSQLEEEIIEHQKIEKELAFLATIDPLTQIPNRRKFDDVLRYELDRDARYHNELALIFCDLDNFKSVNDRYGHKTGDEVLQEFTRLISSKIRKTDIFARWGGEEFAILMPETCLATAIQTAEKLRSETENNSFPRIGKITASFGVSQLIFGDNENTFINRADNALYNAKKNGRNRVEILPLSSNILQTLSAVS